MPQINRKNRNGVYFGFSLVELLIVIGVISILLSILLPAVFKIKTLAMRLICAHNLKQIYIAMDLYMNGNDDTYPSADPNDPLPTGHWLWMGRGWRGFIEPYLGVKIDANHPSVLCCPQDRTAKNDWESTSYSYSMSFYHSPEQIDTMNSTAYTYSNPNTPPQPSYPQKCLSVAYPSEKILIGEWLSNHLRIEDEKDKGWWIWKGARNFLFADCHIVYLKADQIQPANDGLPDANLTIRGIKGRDYLR